MLKRSLGQIAMMVGGNLASAQDADIHIEGVSKDSRTLEPGQLFIPLDIGLRFDGHTFVEAAFLKGARASLWQKDRPNPPANRPLIYVSDTTRALQQLANAYRNQLSVQVVGITGSNGKTTTKDMLASILAQKGKVHKTEGNLNNHIGLPMTILEMDENTEWLVLEMGMSGKGEIETLTQIAQPNAAIITNIGEAHLLQLGSRSHIANAKLEIISGMRSGAHLIYTGDEPLLNERLQLSPEEFMHTCGFTRPQNLSFTTFGTHSNSDVRIESIKKQTGKQGNIAIIHPFKQPFRIPVLGKHNVMNAAAAAACARYFHFPDNMIEAGLADVSLSEMRAEIIKLPNGAIVMNEAFNASPTSVRASLTMLAEMETDGRRFAVLGDMLELGDSEIALHAEIGAELRPDVIHQVYTLGPLAKHIAIAAKERCGADSVHTYTEKDKLIWDLRADVKPGDLILVKGSRGMKMEEVIDGLFDEKGE